MELNSLNTRPGCCPEILKFVLKLELGPEIRTYILKFFMRFHNFFKYEGRSINKLQNGAIPLILKI